MTFISSSQFIAYYSKEGKIVAAASMQMDPVVMKISELLSHGTMVSLEEIKSGKVRSRGSVIIPISQITCFSGSSDGRTVGCTTRTRKRSM